MTPANRRRLFASSTRPDVQRAPGVHLLDHKNGRRTTSSTRAVDRTVNLDYRMTDCCVMRFSICVSVCGFLGDITHAARGVSLALSYRSACCLSAARHAPRACARAPAASSTPHNTAAHAPGHHSPRRRTGARLAQPWKCLRPPRAALHTGARRAPRSGGLHTGRPTTDTSTPPGWKTTNQRHKYAPRAGRKRCCVRPQGHNAGDAGRWSTAALGRRPGNGVAALFLPCERGSHRHTAVGRQRPAACASFFNYFTTTHGHWLVRWFAGSIHMLSCEASTCAELSSRGNEAREFTPVRSRGTSRGVRHAETRNSCMNLINFYCASTKQIKRARRRLGF